jgi:hypothetical protein
MYIPDAIRKCVVFIGYQLANGTTGLAGTGFLVGRPFQQSETPNFGAVTPSFAYLITAKHVLDGIRKKGLDEVWIRLNSKDGIARWANTKMNDWQFHPTEKDTVDVAIFNASGATMGASSNFDHGIFPIGGFTSPEQIDAERIGLGDEIVIVGLFASHHGNTKNIPIVRIGNIAAMPEEKVVTELGSIDAYLVEARSIGGLSGSPVFLNQGMLRVRDGVTYMFPAGSISLLGLMHGHYDDQKVNMGIGIVVPAAKILEVLNQEAILKIENESREFDTAQKMPTMDIVADSEENTFTEQDFERSLRKVSRRIQPSQSDAEKK